MKHNTIATTCSKQQVQAWYALEEGSVRDKVGIKSKKLKDGTFKVRVFIKAGVELEPVSAMTELAKAVAFLGRAA